MSHPLIDTCLFKRDKSAFNEVKKQAMAFASEYIVNPIVQDDIFSVIRDYGKNDEYGIELIRFPINDKEICGCCSIKNDIVFVYINSFLPLEKQIFTAAHELYHVICYEETNLFEPTVTKETELDLGNTGDKEARANAFAAQLLVPKDTLFKTLKMKQMDKKSLTELGMVHLMDAFAVPFKTMVIRLFEEDIIDEKQAEDFLEIPDRDENDGILKIIQETGISLRWQQHDGDIQLGSLEEYLLLNDRDENITFERANKDRERINQVKKLLREESRK